MRMFLADIPLNIDWQQILLHLLNFVILVGGLYLLLYNPVKKFMAKRKAHYAEMDSKAQTSLASAKQKEEEVSQRLAALEAEIAAKKAAAAKEIETYTNAKISEAQKQADTIITEANLNAKKETEKIITNANKEIKQIVTEATKKVITNSPSEAFDEFLKASKGSEDNGKN